MTAVSIILGKLADDSYFENLAVHVADQGGGNPAR